MYQLHNNRDDYLAGLKAALDDTKDGAQLLETIVNAPFCDKAQTTSLGLGIVVLLLVDKTTRTIDRIALSRTEHADGAVSFSAKPFKEIKIPLDYDKNIISKAIATGEYQMTDDWQYMFIPALTPQEARFNQAGAGIGCSVVYPLSGVRDGGGMIFSYYEPLECINSSHHDFMKAYVELVAESLSR